MVERLKWTEWNLREEKLDKVRNTPSRAKVRVN
jgi:hypothetical protein